MSQLQLPKLLEFWSPPSNAGGPIGCVTTTFTLNTQFFEEECLARYLCMESDLDSDGSLYLIEREEKMAGVQCAAVLADYRRCQGAHSPRWDLIPIRSRGIMHAKISLLCWTNHIRVIVSSANMTVPGYRSNQEVFTALDYSLTALAPLDVLEHVLLFLQDLMQEQKQMAPDASERVLKLLQWAKDSTQFWNRKSNNDSESNSVFVYPLLLSPGSSEERNLLIRIKNIWDKHDSSPARKAYVVSPFFDSSNSENKPSKIIWDLLSKRGPTEVNYSLIARESSARKDVVVNAPKTLQDNAPTYRNEVAVMFYKVIENIKEGKEDIYRPLHMKSIWLENDKWALAMIGSSNFTSGGLGLGNKYQREANLVYVVNKAKEPKLYKALTQVWPDEVKIKEHLVWEPLPNEEESEMLAETPLDAFFGAATLEQGPTGGMQILLTFTNTPPPTAFHIYDQNERLLYSEDDWREAAHPNTVTISWDKSFTPSHLLINWFGIEKKAWWPINVKDYTILPPPEELKDLSLDILILALGSARPLHQVLKGQLHQNTEENGGHLIYNSDILDPHKMVDTSTFLLQRTRRISAGMRALQERLRKPVYTKEALDWRMKGPVGVKALADAICKEANTDEEKAFILAELALEISEIEPTENEQTLSRDLVKQSLIDMVKALTTKLPKAQISRDLEVYVQEAFQKAKEVK